LSLAVAGWDGYAGAISHQVRMGDHLRRRLAETGWEVVNETPLPVVCFVDRSHRDGRTLPYLEAISRTLVDRGRAWLSTTILGGTTPVLRACISNYGPAPADVEVLIDELDACRRRHRPGRAR